MCVPPAPAPQPSPPGPPGHVGPTYLTMSVVVLSQMYSFWKLLRSNGVNAVTGAGASSTAAAASSTVAAATVHAEGRVWWLLVMGPPRRGGCLPVRGCPIPYEAAAGCWFGVPGLGYQSGKPTPYAPLPILFALCGRGR